jgi:hypothetical protein
MKRLLFGLLVIACSAAPCGAAGLQLSIVDGKVSIDAQDVTIRQILTEWARIGRTRIVNVERLSGGPITIKLDAVPEKQALETILRNVPGYIASPREGFVANASIYDTILIMPTTTAVAAVRPPNAGYTGLQGGFPGGGANITALRPPMLPGMMPPELPDPAADQANDPALAAAAAAGLVPVPAMAPGPASASAPLVMPGGIPQSSPSPQAAPGPSNPWNAPVGTAQPSLPAPPQPAETQPTGRPRPPMPDR